jgi:hypothetical protein
MPRLLPLWRSSHQFQRFGSTPTSRIYSDISDLFRRFGFIPMFCAHSDVLELTLQSPCRWFNISGVLSSSDASPSFWTSFLLFCHPLDLLLSSYSFLFCSDYVPFVSQHPPNIYYSFLLSCWTSISVTTSQSQYLSDINVLSYLSSNINLDFRHSPLLSLPTSSSGLCGRVSAKV